MGCNGCILRTMKRNGKCFVVFENTILNIVSSKCPCKDCIVKMMCHNSCKEFLDQKGAHIEKSKLRRTN